MAGLTFCNSPNTLYVPSVGASGGVKYRSSGGTSNARRSLAVHFLPGEVFDPADSFLIFSNFSMLSVVKCFQNGGGGGKAAVRARCVSAMLGYKIYTRNQESATQEVGIQLMRMSV